MFFTMCSLNLYDEAMFSHNTASLLFTYDFMLPSPSVL